MKNKKFSPPDQPAPRHGPNNRKQDSQPEEQRLRNLGSDVVAYLEFAGKTPGVQRAEYQAKQEQARMMRRKQARIPEMLEIETFPFERQPKLNRKLVMSLYDSFDTMLKTRDLIWMGPTGCGKTGLATGLITTNLGFSDWKTFLKNENLTAALVDRLTSSGQPINVRNCKSLRPKSDDQSDSA